MNKLINDKDQILHCQPSYRCGLRNYRRQ